MEINEVFAMVSGHKKQVASDGVCNYSSQGLNQTIFKLKVLETDSVELKAIVDQSFGESVDPDAV